jgi:spermidine/putrescine-binding protein
MDEAYIRAMARHDLDRISRLLFLKRAGGAAAVLGGGSALLAACGGSSSGSGDKVGGQLTFVGVDGEDAPAIAKPFLTKNGVKLKSTYVADNDTMLTKLRTGGTKQFDVMTINKDFAPREIELKFVRTLDTGKLTHFSNLAQGLQSAPWIKSGADTYGFPLIWGSEPCVYNPKKFKGVPPKYTDFADKKFAHSLTTIDEPYGNQWLVAKSLKLGENGNYNRLTQTQLDKVRDAWIGIKKNVVSMTAAFGDQTDLLVRGEAAIALNSWQALLQFAKPKGVTLAFANPADDGTYYWSDSYYMAVKSPNPATAYAYINYMSTPQANAKIADSLQSACTSAKAVGKLPSGSISRQYDYKVVQDKVGGDFIKSIIPPEAADGNIVGKQAWVKSWEEVKAS